MPASQAGRRRFDPGRPLSKRPIEHAAGHQKPYSSSRGMRCSEGVLASGPARASHRDGDVENAAKGNSSPSRLSTGLISEPGSGADRGVSSLSGTLTRSFGQPLSQGARRPSEPAEAGLPEIRSVLVAQTIRDLCRGEGGIREELERELAAMGIAELTIRRAGFPEPADQRR